MVYTGTMGWSYDDWRGPFYDRTCRPADLLRIYATIFPAVELDATFFGVPRASTLDGWAAQTPAHFRFTAKTPRSVTHERRLAGSACDEARAFGGLLAERLGPKLGALLIQLPPEFAAGPTECQNLEEFAEALAGDGLPWVVELRHASWAEPAIAVASRLGERGIGLASTERFDVAQPVGYVRLLGEEGSVARFDERQLDKGEELVRWAKRIAAAPGDVFVFVRNYYEGHAPGTLFALQALLGQPVVEPPGRRQLSLF